ncbi:LytTR family transcriptional regulator DNA-binding domain-containing protein [Acetobacteraceae bacterium KSS8]|uniref:LytTR family transcriptional regulator DNA-binding domain-containing protein n=1 Tax=Endosaccharibacter trunci TaxID=2812733 RepID=A0ABT1W905_9PROT|nr:LytTR family transcriptional regulator DNA-binding domain-containing protein [Acetobacteraceae bacterium KSS8]
MQSCQSSRRRQALSRLASLLAIAALLTIMAPWHSERMPVTERAGYFLLCGAFWQAGVSLARFGLGRAGLRLSPARSVLATALLASVPGVLGILLVNRIVFGHAGPMLLIWAETLPLGLAAAFAYRGVVLSGPMREQTPLSASAPAAEAQQVAPSGVEAVAPEAVLSTRPGDVRAFLLAHAPEFAGRRLIALQAEDHYLRLYLEAAEKLVLLRMRDAIAALGETAGWQPHRSFWIARDARGRAERRGQGWQLVLENGLVVPVSRTAVPAMRAAGFGPATRRVQSSDVEASIIAVGSTAE